MPPPPPALLDELVEEILLRLPPDEPASLLRASLVCKRWRRRLSDPRFLRRYRELHGAPPMLGIIYTFPEARRSRPLTIPLVARSAPTTGLRPSPLEMEGFCALDCRHGRVLLQHEDLLTVGRSDLVVWDPLTGSRRRLRDPDIEYGAVGAAVLCAAEGGSCDHGACSGGPFRILFVCRDLHSPGVTLAFVYSSVTDEWSAPASLHVGANISVGFAGLPGTSGVLVGDALYFLITRHAAILEYDLGRHCLSVIQLPMPMAANKFDSASPSLLAANDGVLGIAFNNMSRLELWSMEAGRHGVAATWAHHRVIHLNTLLPTDDPGNPLEIITFVEGTNIVIVATHLGYYTIDLKSLRSMKLKLPESERKSMRPTRRRKCFGMFPYMRFYNPPGPLVHDDTDAEEPEDARLGLGVAQN